MSGRLHQYHRPAAPPSAYFMHYAQEEEEEETPPASRNDATGTRESSHHQRSPASYSSSASSSYPFTSSSSSTARYSSYTPSDLSAGAAYQQSPYSQPRYPRAPSSASSSSFLHPPPSPGLQQSLLPSSSAPRVGSSFLFAPSTVHGSPAAQAADTPPPSSSSPSPPGRAGERGGGGESDLDPTSQFTRAAIEGTMRVGSRVGSALLVEGGKFLERNRLIGEGPKPLRALCFLGGLALVVVNALQALNVFAAFGNPAAYLLQSFLVLFGVGICVVEAKDVSQLERLQPFFANWFKFLTVPLGKGIFYILVGSIAISQWTANLLLLLVGGYMMTMGLICVLVHFGLRQHLRERGIEVSEENGSGFSRDGRLGVGEQLSESQLRSSFFTLS